MDSVFEIKMRRQRREVVGIMIHVVAVGDLARAAMAEGIISNDAKAVVEEEQHLRVPVLTAANHG